MANRILFIFRRKNTEYFVGWVVQFIREQQISTSVEQALGATARLLYLGRREMDVLLKFLKVKVPFIKVYQSPLKNTT